MPVNVLALMHGEILDIAYDRHADLLDLALSERDENSRRRYLERASDVASEINALEHADALTLSL